MTVRLIHAIAHAVRNLLREPQVERELDDELRFHLDAQIEAHRRAGLSLDEARRQATLTLGGAEQVKEQVRAVRRGAFMDTLWQDLRYAVRLLRRSPGFTVVAVVTLALGIGANTAIFSVVNSILLQPLPYRQPDELLHVWHTRTGQVFHQMEAAYPNFAEWREQSQTIVGFAGYNGTSFTLTGLGLPEHIRAERVTTNFFTLLGVEPLLGRWFHDDEEPLDVVIVSYGFWQSRFAGAADVIGKTIALNGRPYTVIGVLHNSFQFSVTRAVDLWVPTQMSDSTRSRRNLYWLNTIARLRPGVTLAQARAEMDELARRQARAYPESNTGVGVRLLPLDQQVSGGVRPFLLVLLGGVTFVLLIACVNVANLLLARGTGRDKEMALRWALGAGRARLVRQLLVESLLLSLLGGAAGYWAARAGVNLLLTVIPEMVQVRLSYLQRVHVDSSVLLFALGISLLTGIAFGILPAWQASRPRGLEALKEGSRTSGGQGHRRFRDSLVVVQVSLALVLLAGAGLILRSLTRLLAVNPGFDPSSIVSMRVSLPLTRYNTAAQVVTFHEQLLARVAALPGVQDAALTDRAPLTGSGGTLRVIVEGRPAPPPGQEQEAVGRSCSPGFFSMLRIPLLAGRFFTVHDRFVSATAPLKVILSRTLAQRLFPDEDPIGHRLIWPPGPIFMEIVGVVGDVSMGDLDEQIRPVLYTALLQDPSPNADLLVRSGAGTAAVVSAVRGEVQALDQELALYAVGSLEQFVVESTPVFFRRALMLLLGLFAAVAVLMASIGIYGLLNYSVAQRNREIGIRMALGAERAHILRLILRHGLWLAGAGIAFGVAGGLLLAPLSKAVLFGVSAADWQTFTAVALLLAAVAVLACYVPARRATRVDPMVALRYE